MISLFAQHTNGDPQPLETSATEKVCVPSSHNNWCAPKKNPKAESVIDDLEREGFVCSKTPSLTEHLVFQFRDLHIEVVTFDKAREFGEQSAGWVQAFCVR